MLRYHGLRKGAAIMLDGCGKCMGGGKNSLSDEGRGRSFAQRRRVGFITGSGLA